MRVCKTRWFNRWARKQRLSDRALRAAIEEMEQGLIDADLGGHVYKKRVALAGRGKRGGYRTIIAYRLADRAFDMYGFAKNERSNIDEEERRTFKAIAQELLTHGDALLNRLMEDEELFEVLNDE